MNGGGIRGGKVYRAGRDHHPARRAGGTAVRQPRRDGRGQRARPAARDRERPLAAAERGGPLSAGVRPDGRSRRQPPAGSRITSITVGGAPLDEAKTYRVATNDFMARGGDGYNMFRDAQPVLPDVDAPLLANEVMVYIRKAGTVRTGVEGRIVLR